MEKSFKVVLKFKLFEGKTPSDRYVLKDFMLVNTHGEYIRAYASNGKWFHAETDIEIKEDIKYFAELPAPSIVAREHVIAKMAHDNDVYLWHVHINNKEQTYIGDIISDDITTFVFQPKQVAPALSNDMLFDIRELISVISSYAYSEEE